MSSFHLYGDVMNRRVSGAGRLCLLRSYSNSFSTMAHLINWKVTIYQIQVSRHHLINTRQMVMELGNSEMCLELFSKSYDNQSVSFKTVWAVQRAYGPCQTSCCIFGLGSVVIQCASIFAEVWVLVWKCCLRNFFRDYDIILGHHMCFLHSTDTNKDGSQIIHIIKPRQGMLYVLRYIVASAVFSQHRDIGVWFVRSPIQTSATRFQHRQVFWQYNIRWFS